MQTAWVQTWKTESRAALGPLKLDFTGGEGLLVRELAGAKVQAVEMQMAPSRYIVQFSQHI